MKKEVLLLILLLLLLVPTANAIGSYVWYRNPTVVYSDNDDVDSCGNISASLYDQNIATYIITGAVGDNCDANMTFSIPSNYLNGTDYWFGIIPAATPWSGTNYTLPKGCLYNSSNALQSSVIIHQYGLFTGTWGCRGSSQSCWNYQSSSFSTIYSYYACFGSHVTYHDQYYEGALLLNLSSGINTYLNGTHQNLTAYNNITVNFTCNSSIPVSVFYNGSVHVNASAKSLGVGLHVFSCNNTDGVNESLYVTVNSFQTVNLLLNGSNLSVNASWQYPLNVSCQSNVSVTLYRNGSLITNDAVYDLDAGYYVFSCNNSDGDNRTLFFNLSKAVSDCSLLLNGSAGNAVVTWPNAVNAEGFSSYGSALLYRNSSLVSNPDSSVLAAGLYSYKANYSGSVNVSSCQSAERNYTVNKASGYASLTVNHSGIEGSAGSIECLGSPDENLYFDGVLVSSVYSTPVLGAGTYSMVCNSSGSVNFTASSNSSSLVVVELCVGSFSPEFVNLSVLLVLLFGFLIAIGRPFMSKDDFTGYALKLVLLFLALVFVLYYVSNWSSIC